MFIFLKTPSNELPHKEATEYEYRNYYHVTLQYSAYYAGSSEPVLAVQNLHN